MTYLPRFAYSLRAIAILILATCSVDAQTTPTPDVPRTLSYQGLLSSGDGLPIADGRYQLTVTLYADPNGTVPVWSDSYTADINAGLFNLNLGEGKPLPDPSSMNRSLWIGTSIDGADEMRPLTPLTASPYALNVSDNAITTEKLVDGAVTAEKIATDYISDIRIDGQKVTSRGSGLNLVSTPGVPLTYDEATGSVTIGRVATPRGADEKAPSVLANQDQVWSANGDGWDIAAGANYLPVPGDWLGTSGGVDLVLKVNSQQVMQYQPSGAAIPNIIGGQANTITAATSVGSIIAQGAGHSISNGDYHTIAGGQDNLMDGGTMGAIGGGRYNAIYETKFGVISGGEMNSINSVGSLSREHATIGGGSSNEVWSSEGTIAGGHDNGVYSFASTIGGGEANIVGDVSTYAFIGGGHANDLNTNFGVIAGGESNSVAVTAATHATIGGGEMNVVEASHGTIPGGDLLSTEQSYAQSAMGFYNAPRGAMPIRPSSGQIAASNDPLFMIGNGDVWNAVTSNAFEVSYNGHSTVYGVNGSGTVNPAITGATYVDNVIYAWGDIDKSGAVNADFGVSSVLSLGAGVYDITINVTDPQGNPVVLNDASITATIVEEPHGDVNCASISTTRLGAIGPNMFRVRTYRQISASCRATDIPFMFKVTGRP